MLSEKPCVLAFVVQCTFLLLLVCGLAACGEREVPAVAPSEVTIIEQDVNERIYSDWSLEKVGIEKPPVIGDVEQLRIFDDRMFVYDLADMKVKCYALSGEVEAIYGLGRGEGPGEFQNIYSFWVRKNEVVWIVDSMRRTVARFQYDGTFVDSFQPEFMPARVAALDEDVLVILTYMQPELFAIVNGQGEVQKSFTGMIEEYPDVPTLLFDGHLFPDANGGFIWAPRFASYLFFYSQEAALERRMALIDGHPFPTDRIKSNPANFSAANLRQPHRTMVASVTEGEIFVNTIIREGEETFSVMDRYDRVSGKYIDSVHLPRGGSQYQVHKGIMYSAGADTTLWAFTFQLPR